MGGQPAGGGLLKRTREKKRNNLKVIIKLVGLVNRRVCLFPTLF